MSTDSRLLSETASLYRGGLAGDRSRSSIVCSLVHTSCIACCAITATVHCFGAEASVLPEPDEKGASSGGNVPVSSIRRPIRTLSSARACQQTATQARLTYVCRYNVDNICSAARSGGRHRASKKTYCSFTDGVRPQSLRLLTIGTEAELSKQTTAAITSSSRSCHFEANKQTIRISNDKGAIRLLDAWWEQISAQSS